MEEQMQKTPKVAHCSALLTAHPQVSIQCWTAEAAQVTKLRHTSGTSWAGCETEASREMHQHSSTST